MWESTTKYFSPFFSYTANDLRIVVVEGPGGGQGDAAGQRRHGPHHT
jgi:hypothetical protein